MKDIATVARVSANGVLHRKLLNPVFALLLVSTLLSPGVPVADVCKWVDEHGITHYSDSPPDSGKAGKLRIEPPAQHEGDAWKRSEQEADKAKRARAERQRLQGLQEGADAAARMSRGAQESRCRRARQQLEALTRGGPVYRRDETGKRIYLEDSLRDAEIVGAQREVHAACGDGPEDRIGPGAADRGPHDSDREQCLKARERLTELEQPSMRSPNSDIRMARDAVKRLCGPEN